MVVESHRGVTTPGLSGMKSYRFLFSSL